MKFHKFMRCNEKSPVKLSEASLWNGTYSNYKCWEEMDELYDVCILYHMKILFEMYYFRSNNDYFKPISHNRIWRKHTVFYRPESAQRLYY
jgi:hypothetical protein